MPNNNAIDYFHKSCITVTQTSWWEENQLACDQSDDVEEAHEDQAAFLRKMEETLPSWEVRRLQEIQQKNQVCPLGRHFSSKIFSPWLSCFETKF